MAFASTVRRLVDQAATIANVGLYSFTWHHSHECSVEMSVLVPGDRAYSLLEVEWKALESKTQHSPFFLGWHWVGTWLREIVSGRTVLVARVRDSGSETVALALVALVEEHWGPLTSRVAYFNEVPIPRLDMTIEQNGCLALPGWEGKAFAAVVDALARTALRIEEIRCRGIDERFMQPLKAGRPGHPWLIDQVRPAWIIHTPPGTDLETLLGGLSKNKRWQIRRFLRLAEEKYGPLEVSSASDLASAEAYFGKLAELHNAYWQGRGRAGVFSNEKWRSFHRALIRDMLPLGNVQLLRIFAGDFEVGYLYNIKHGREIINIQSGFAYQEDNRWRPGYASHLLAAAVGAAEGYEQYNLLVGDDAYKSSLGKRGDLAHWFSVYPRRAANKRYLLFRLIDLLRRVRAHALPKEHGTGVGRNACPAKSGLTGAERKRVSLNTATTEDTGVRVYGEMESGEVTPAAAFLPSCIPVSIPDVVVLDGDLTQSLTIVRSLGRAGARVHVIASHRKAVALQSRYCTEAIVLQNPVSGGEQFVKQLAGVLTRFQRVLVFPVSDRSLLPLVEFEQLLPANTTVVRASNEALAQALSKAETLRIAEECGVPQPGSFTVTSEAEIEAVIARVPFPQVIKADRSFAADDSGKLHNHAVKYAADANEARVYIRALLADGVAVLVQQLVKGDGVGYGALAHEGKILTEFQWRRLHEVPITGGGSSYRVSEPVDPVLRQYAAGMLGEMRWTGVAMVEFKHDPVMNRYYLMEINGRFWGSLPLAFASGADFPAELYSLYQGVPPKQRAYRTGLRCRLLSKDLEWILQALELRGAPRAPSLRSIVLDTLRMAHPNDRLDVQDWSDLKPGLHDLKSLLTQNGKRVLKRLRRA